MVDVARPYDKGADSNGPYTRGPKLIITPGGRQGNKVRGVLEATGKRVHLIDWHGEIFAHSFHDPEHQALIREAAIHAMQQGIGVMGPGSTTHQIESARAAIATDLFQETGVLWNVEFYDGATTANQAAFGVGHAFLRGETTHVLGIGTAYSGGGANRALADHPGYGAAAGRLFQLPGMTWLKGVDTEEGYSTHDSFAAFMEDRKDEYPRIIRIAEAGVLGVGGWKTLPAHEMREQKRVLHDQGAFTIDDCVQTAWHRAGGRWWASGIINPYDPDTIPNAITFGKAVGGGYGLAGWALQRSTYDQLDLRSVGANYCTAGRDHVRAAAFNAAHDISRTTCFKTRALEGGRQHHATLRDLARQYPEMIVRETGQGLMSGLEFRAHPNHNDGGWTTLAELTRIGLEEVGLRFAVGGQNGQCARLGPGLDSTSEQLAEGHTRLADGLQRLKRWWDAL